MAIKEIIKTPNPILTTPSNPVQNFDAKLERLVEDLVDTLNSAKNPGGTGIAAPQIGVLERVCIARNFQYDNSSTDVIETENYEDFIMINPEIIKSSQATDVEWEGCLSIPEIYGRVERSKNIKVKYYDTQGAKKVLKVSGFLARVMQHEIDHLNGVLFTSKTIGKTMTEKEVDELYES